MKYKYLDINENDSYCEIWLNRPEKRNALNMELVKELQYFFSHQYNQLSAEFVILRGRGKTFCSGVDLYEFISDKKNAFVDQFSELLYIIYSIKIPLISILHGRIFGGGLGLAAVSDIVLADDDSKFCFSEVKMGLAPAIISTYLDLKVNKGISRYLMLSAKQFDVNQAKTMGLVHEIIDLNRENEVKDFLNIFTSNSLRAIHKTKQLLNYLNTTQNIKQRKIFAGEMIKESIQSEDAIRKIKNFLKI